MRKGCARHLKVAIFSSVFDIQRPFRAKGLRGTPQSRNFSSVFDVQRPFRAKGLRATDQSRNFSSVFDVQRPFRAVAGDASKSQFYLGFGRPTSISCERVAFRGAPAAPPPP